MGHTRRLIHRYLLMNLALPLCPHSFEVEEHFPLAVYLITIHRTIFNPLTYTFVSQIHTNNLHIMNYSLLPMYFPQLLFRHV